MLRKWFLLGLITLTLSNLLMGKAFAQGEKQMSLKDMCSKSTEIILAKVISKYSYYTFDRKNVLTEVTLKVTKKIKGKFNVNETIKISTYGGTIDGITTFIAGGPTFQPNMSSIFFLEERKPSKASNVSNHTIVGFSQGKFDVIEDKNGKKVQRGSDGSLLMLDESGNSLDFSHGKSFSLDNFLQQITKYL